MHVDMRMIPQPAFVRSADIVVLHAEAREYAHRIVVHGDRERYLDDAIGLREPRMKQRIEIEPIRGVLKLFLGGVPRINAHITVRYTLRAAYITLFNHMRMPVGIHRKQPDEQAQCQRPEEHTQRAEKSNAAEC